jgi:hypothetical protein
VRPVACSSLGPPTRASLHRPGVDAAQALRRGSQRRPSLGVARWALLIFALPSLAGCRSYEGPNLGGTWDAVGFVTSTSQSLVLAHDPDAALDYELRGTFVDARGEVWPIEADPVAADFGSSSAPPAPRGFVGAAADGEWRVTLRGGLLLVDDAGERTELDTGPLRWSLTGVHAGDRLVLEVKPVERLLGIDPPEGPWRRVTFVRRGVPGSTPPPAMPAPKTASPPPGAEDRCAGCGEPLEARWTVCPVCARPRPAEGEPGR